MSLVGYHRTFRGLRTRVRFTPNSGRGAPETLRSAFGCVSRVSPVQTALRNCTRDEGGPVGFGDRELIPSYRKLLWSTLKSACI